ncbi:MAG: hypothetical protein COA42_05380 [Alteromonadaceae bacterium]|nr:MAG: hypothetical protein COA42_05380 [Alteromonadaceae bacterium]
MIIACALGSIALAVVSYYSGYHNGVVTQGQTLADITALQQQAHTRGQQVRELEQQLANVHLGTEVDKKANENVRRGVLELKAEIAQLQEQNGFYRGLMEPTDNEHGLSFGKIEIRQTDRPNVFAYKVVVQQLATDHRLLSGTLSYAIKGRFEQAPASLSLHDVSAQQDTALVKLRFKYFQTIEGELTLPPGFEPEGIELVAKSTGKNAVVIDKQFGWLVEEI